ncbi:MAG: hypothetical protein KatS3mg009_0619 [Acidimicrobiia bacterium]|nr:MAG: hypothetical protein KatS3mg009_0619 [Acidimicrobiia bacterium]
MRTVPRQCARPGCSSAATATFTFDARERTVWLDAPADGQARAGELCERHARTLTPPQGWRLDDRRPATAGGPRPEPVGVAVTDRRDAAADARTLLHARSPLLARAFESSGRL